MTLNALKEIVRDLISKAKPADAMDAVNTWAYDNSVEQLKDDIALLKSDLSDLNREKTLGVLDNSEAVKRQNQLNYRLISLLNAIKIAEPKSVEVKTIPTIKNETMTQPKIYFSYAWTDKKEKEAGVNREQIVSDLYQSLKADGYDVRRDKENVGYKDSISEFMKEIGDAGFIVVAISKKYLESANCMFEMLQIYRKSNSDLDELNGKIYPIVLEGTKIYDPLDRLKYVRFWKDKKETLEKEINEIGLAETIAIIGNDYKNYKEINDNIALISSLIADLNTLDPEVLSHDNFEEIKKAIKARGEAVKTKPAEDTKSVNTIIDTIQKAATGVIFK
jgi:TIR domain/Effector-associated domain 11